MASLWPWLAVAGLGALHGLSPANGWLFAAARGVQAGSAAHARRALWPIAIGHAASVGAVACVVAQGVALDRARFQTLAGALLVGAALFRSLRGAPPRRPVGAPGRDASLALWSFLMATAHGTGLMLVPALVPLCLSDGPAREITASGSMLWAAAAVGVHTVAMLATTGAIATGVCRGLATQPHALRGTRAQQFWTVALAASGIVLMLPR